MKPIRITMRTETIKCNKRYEYNVPPLIIEKQDTFRVSVFLSVGSDKKAFAFHLVAGVHPSLTNR